MDSIVDNIDEKYKLKSLIGQGSRGRVYLAEETESGKERAIKFLSEEEFPDNTLAAKHIKHEAQCLQLCAHANVVSFVATGENQSGRPYLVIEYLNGKSLKAMFESGEPDPNTAFEIFRELASTLEHLHKIGVLHMDLRPDKIILDKGKKTYSPKIIGFGRASFLPWSGREDNLELPPKGNMYSLQYISPEKAMDKRCLPTSDVYSLACIMYEAIAGRPPFQGENELHLMAQHLSGKDLQTPSQVKQDAKLKKFDHVILQALSKETHMRFVDAAELKEAMSAVDTSKSWVAKLFNK